MIGSRRKQPVSDGGSGGGHADPKVVTEMALV
jgi:hypothetical protein